MHPKTSKITWIKISALIIVCILAAKPQLSCQFEPCSKPVGSTASFSGSCTTFAAQSGDTVLFGNNEDFDNTDTYLWATPSVNGSYGGIYFGYLYGRPQGGINEKGLAFDALALPQANLTPHPDLPPKGRSDTAFMAKMLSQSATVEEAIDFAQAYNWGSAISFQVLLADASGDAVVISAGPDGELAFTRKPIGDGYLAATNFNQAFPENRSDPPPCRRYDKATELLDRIGRQGKLDIDAFQSILDAVHVEGESQNTLYSNILDLRNGIVYLYFWHQFDEVLTLQVAKQLDHGLAPTRISTFFSDETIQQAEAEYQRHIQSTARKQWVMQNGRIVIGSALGLVGISGLALVLIIRRKKSMHLIGAEPRNQPS